MRPPPLRAAKLLLAALVLIVVAVVLGPKLVQLYDAYTNGMKEAADG